jgi:hypothetical protein
MFELTLDEYNTLRCQTGTLKRGVHSKYAPFAFTEQGVAMLSSVLRSKRAVQVNIAIMRTFVRLREMLASNTELARKLAEICYWLLGHWLLAGILRSGLRQRKNGLHIEAVGKGRRISGCCPQFRLFTIKVRVESILQILNYLSLTPSLFLD